MALTCPPSSGCSRRLGQLPRRRMPSSPSTRPAAEVMTATTAVPDVARLLAALDRVRDPELDEPITSLGFVAACSISADGDAEIRLRLPTYFCAPNFAYLMVDDAYDAVIA